MRLNLLKMRTVGSLYLRFFHSHICKNREVFLVEVCAFASRLSC